MLKIRDGSMSGLFDPDSARRPVSAANDQTFPLE